MIRRGDLYYPDRTFRRKARVRSSSIYKRAEKDPIKFWEKLAKKGIDWFKKWDKAFEHDPPYFRWFVGGKLNTVYNCLDRHLRERKNKVAFFWEPEPPEERERVFTYYSLYREVNRFANALKELGVKKGDIVGIYLPMIPEAVISMLACARIGAVHTVVFSAFSPQALRIRLQETGAKYLITADGYYRKGKVIKLKENADEGIKNTKVKKVIVVERLGRDDLPVNKKDVFYKDLVKNQSDECPPEVMDAEDPLFILFTSGSTGKPKGVIHTCGGYTVQAYWTTRWVFDIFDDDIIWSTADIGWITGHTYGVYGPLLNGATFVLYEGALNYPNPDRWADIIEKYGVTTFYTAPTAIRMFAKHGPVKRDLKTLQILGSVGEPLNEAAWEWYFKEVGKERCPIVDTWWQTECGGIMISSLPGIGPFKPAHVGKPIPGVRVKILDDEGNECPPGVPGNLVILPPFAPGMLRGLYNNHEKYVKTYWSKYGPTIYFTEDQAVMDEHGLIRILGRADDVIKVAGHRLGTGELEDAIAKHPKVSECAVVGAPHEIKGEVPVAFVVLKGKPSEKVKKEIMELVEKEIGPIARLYEVYFVPDLPKTRSGKIMRRILRKILRGDKNYGDLSTLANPDAVEKIEKLVKTHQ